MPAAICCLLVLAALGGVGGGGPVHDGGSASATTASAADCRVGLVTLPLPRPKFVLTDASGASFDFRAKTQGRVTLS